MRTLENSENPDEMLHNAAFYQGLHCSLGQKRYSEKDIQFYLETKICYGTPRYIPWTIPSLLYRTSLGKNPFVHKGLKLMYHNRSGPKMPKELLLFMPILMLFIHHICIFYHVFLYKDHF